MNIATTIRSAIAAAAFVISAFAATSPARAATAEAIFAGGCFWCVEADFDKISGVISTTSGYTGGHVDNPTYQIVTSETSGHKEAVKIVFDPDRVSYEKLLDVYWRHIDPFDARGQFCDKGDSYKPVIFALNAEQKQQALASKEEIDKVLGRKTVVPVVDASTFYPAEDYHQNYYKKNPVRYNYYRSACGRDARVQQVWAGH
ncbi:MAG: peptide-methionine (S)-S-oxide reductase MsrA [Rhodobiaceae bacterium]|nr:peptide-methionine (S)-S-oxide reductase MsrA [Rhodobiaceae bacterium]MCC0055490.1 peptide-methionine (S)-S-oxide reductase MsrA [Rhodobiaceae bacterium]